MKLNKTFLLCCLLFTFSFSKGQKYISDSVAVSSGNDKWLVYKSSTQLEFSPFYKPSSLRVDFLETNEYSQFSLDTILRKYPLNDSIRMVFFSARERVDTLRYIISLRFESTSLESVGFNDGSILLVFYHLRKIE